MKALGHKLNENKIASPSFVPDFTATSVDEIDFKKLQKLGVKHLLFDLDQTLRRPYSRSLPKSVVKLLTDVSMTKRFKTINLVSNNQRNLSRYSQPITAGLFQPFRQGVRIIRKPNPLFFTHVLTELSAQPHECVMIGDRLRADVMGANRMGMFSIYVKKRGAIDYWFDWLMLTRLRDGRKLREAIAEDKIRRHKLKRK